MVIHWLKVGTLPPVLDRVRRNTWMTVGMAVVALVLIAWIGWAVYVTARDGASEGVGVLIAWPALLAAAALVCLPFAGGYLLIRRASKPTSTAQSDVEEEAEATEPG